MKTRYSRAFVNQYFCTMSKKYHLGTLVKNTIQERGISYSEMGRRLNKHSATIATFFDRKDFSTDLLYDLSTTLGKNLFRDIYLEVEHAINPRGTAEPVPELENLNFKKKYDALVEQSAHQDKMIAVLESSVKDKADIIDTLKKDIEALKQNNKK